MKSKIVNIVGGILVLLGITSCNSYLEKESFDIITPEQVWKDPKLINGVMVNLYDGLQLEDFNYWYRDAWRLMNPSTLSDEARDPSRKTLCSTMQMQPIPTKMLCLSRSSPTVTN